METIITSHSVSSLNLKNHSLKSKFNQSLIRRRPSFISSQPSVKLLQYCVNDKLILFSQKKVGGSVKASLAGQSNATDDEDILWLLEPVGDGDSRHIGFKVALPTAFEIASDEVTVGRVPDKADIVIPVATVSGTHARFQKKGGALFVTDLDSTNGTFIDEKRLTPGVPAVVPPGRYITFGDTNLAIFRVSKLKNVKPVANISESEPETESETGDASNVVENTS
ncbi:zeaxanthin epoxidase, chloroplastic-like [Bidens hawaiensis]|uniref:zeaxanthin epoxidase, chloroplastic-like n=1 Tax=Bidens hawaiensis TaxID=980011 RepID=UPI00404B8B05